jgi:hypothetical protein
MREDRGDLPIKIVLEAGQAGGEALLLSFWASCSNSDDALQVAFYLTDGFWLERGKGAGKRRAVRRDQAQRDCLGSSWDAGDGCRSDDGNEAPGDTRHTLLGLENGPLELTCPLGLFMYVLCSQISDDHVNGCSR